MKVKVILKRSIDAVMYILFLLLMGEYVLRGAVHEWMGISLGILFIVHNLLNYKWYKTLLKGKFNAVRTVQLVINILLLAAMLFCMISGILISQHIFAVGNGETIEFGRHLHLVSTAWAFVLMNFHLGLHWSMLSSVSKKICGNENVKKAIHIICCVFTAALFVYGVYQFADRRFWEELFNLIDYQKEYDYSKTLFAYFIESVVMSVPFIATAHYGNKLLKRKTHRLSVK